MATTKVDEDVDGGPLGVLSGALAKATTEVDEDVNGGPPGWCCREPRQRPPPKLMKASMAGPLGGCCRKPRQWSPPKSMKTSMAGPLGMSVLTLRRSIRSYTYKKDVGPMGY
jgi:hypothetical protein